MTLKPEGDREWYPGESSESFAAAARIAVENAERKLERISPEYDVRLQVLAEGPLSGFRVLVSPTS